LQSPEINHYETLGLDPACTAAEIRGAYRLLSKRFHPDLNNGSAEAIARTLELNAAHEVLGDPAQRETYDLELKAAAATRHERRGKIDRNITHEVHLRIEDFIRGTTLDIRVTDPANPRGPETYRLVVPPETAAGAGFKLPRVAPFEDAFVLVRLRALSGARFKVRGADLRCDLRITAQRATAGGIEMITGPTGAIVRVEIPRNVARGASIRIPGEGMPNRRGGRGDLLLRVMYRAEVRASRST